MHLNICLSYDTDIPSLGILPWEMEVQVHTKTCSQYSWHSHVNSHSFIYNGRKLETKRKLETEMAQKRWLAKETSVLPNKTVSDNKKESTNARYHKMNLTVITRRVQTAWDSVYRTSSATPRDLRVRKQMSTENRKGQDEVLQRATRKLLGCEIGSWS